MSEPAEAKRGPGRPRKTPYEAPAEDVDRIAPDFDLQSAVLAAARKSFPTGELSMKEIGRAHV